MTRSKLALAIGASCLLALATTGIVEGTSWVGRSFPGFLVLENGVVASAGLERWPATRDGAIYQHQVVAVDDRAVSTGSEVVEAVRALPEGTPVTYRFRAGDAELVRSIETRRFDWADFGWLFGAYLGNGLLMGGTVLLLLARRGGHPALAGAAPFLVVGAVWGFTAVDLYGPYRLFRLHALAEVLLFPAAVQMALLFPRRAALLDRRPWLLVLPWAAALGLAAVYQSGLREPATYVTAHLLATTGLGLGLAVLVASQLARLAHCESDVVRRQAGTFTVGVLAAVGLPMVLTIAEAMTGGRAPQNAVAFTSFALPLAIAYALLRSDLASLTAPARALGQAR